MAAALRLLPNLNIELAANVTRFNTDMNSAVQIAEKTVGKIQGTINKLGAGLAGLSTAFAFGRILEEASGGEKAFAQLQAAVRSTGAAAGLTAKQLSDMAGALQKKSIFDDDTIAGAEAVMLTFTKIGKEVFPEATQAAVDMATRMNTDLQSATVQLSKALQDPVKGITALSKAGVSFSESQKATIKTLVESNRLLDAQKIILKEVNQEFGGSALAARNTIGGSMTAATNSFNNLLEAIGRVQSSGLKSIFTGLSDVIDYTAEHARLLSNAILGIASGAAIAQLAKVPTMLTTIATIAQKAFAALGTGAALATGGLSLVVAAAITFKDELFNIGDQQVTLQNLVVATWENISRAINRFVETNRDAVMSTFTGMINSIQSTLSWAINGIKQFSLQALDVAKSILQYAPGGEQLLKSIGEAQDAVKNFTAEPLKGFVDGFSQGVDSIVKDAARMTAAQQAALNVQEKLGNGVPQDAAALSDKQKKHLEEFERTIAAIEARNEALKQELAGNEDLAKIKETQMQLESHIGKLSAKELETLKAKLTLQRELTVAKQLHGQQTGLEGQANEIALELNGLKDMVGIQQLLNQLKSQGVEYGKESKENQQRILELITQTKQLEIGRANVLTKNTIDGLHQETLKLTESLSLSKEQMDIQNQIAEARKANMWITDQQIDKIKEELKLQEQLKKQIAGKEIIKSMQEQTLELLMQKRERELIAKHLEDQAALERAIFDWQKKTNLTADDLTKQLLKQETIRQQALKDAQKAQDIIESTKTAMSKYADKVAELDDLYRKGLLNLQQYQKAVAQINPVMQKIADAAGQMGDAFTNAFDSAIFGGAKLQDTIQNLGKELLHIIAQKALFEPIGNWISSQITNAFQKQIVAPGGPFNYSQPYQNMKQTGSVFGGGFGGFGGQGGGLAPGTQQSPVQQSSPTGGILGGLAPLLKKLGIPFFADGGSIAGGQLAVVGERGPELFLPGRSGTIIPNEIASLFNKQDLAFLTAMLMIPQFIGGLTGNMQMSMPSTGGQYMAASMAAPLTDSNKWAALSQTSAYRSRQMQSMGLGFQATAYELESRRSADYANRMLGQPGGALSWGQAPQNFNTAQDLRGMLEREPQLANFWDPGFVDSVNQFSNGVGRHSYSVLPLTSGGGIDRGGLGFGDGESISGARGYVAHGSVFSPYGGPSGPQSQLGPYGNMDAIAAVARIFGGRSLPQTQFGHGIGMPFSYDPYSGPPGYMPELGTLDYQLARQRGVLDGFWGGAAVPRSGLGFANGGEPPIGFASMVGERGPEMFVPHERGTIIPKDKLGGETNVKVEIHAHGVTAEQIRTEEVQTGPDQKTIRVMIAEMMAAEVRPAGKIGRQLQESYDIKQRRVGR